MSKVCVLGVVVCTFVDDAIAEPAVVVPISLYAAVAHAPLVPSVSCALIDCVVPASMKNAARMHSPTLTDPEAPLVSAVAAAPAALFPPVRNVGGVPWLLAISVSVHVLATGDDVKATVITVPVCSALTFCAVVKIAPCTPALAPAGSYTGDWRFVHVLPMLSVTVVKSLVSPPEPPELSAATQIATSAPAVQFDPGDSVNDDAPVLWLPLPLAVAVSVTWSFHRLAPARLTPR